MYPYLRRTVLQNAVGGCSQDGGDGRVRRPSTNCLAPAHVFPEVPGQSRSI